MPDNTVSVLNSAKLVGFVPITDPQRARAFYQGLLGLEFISDDQFALVFRSGTNTLRLVKSKSVTPAAYTIAGWEVAGIEQAVRNLIARGVEFEKYPWVKDEAGLGIWTAPGGDKVAWFKDPDGNVLSVSEHKTG
jgi:catechol 2,3-dioxygenase-like lactoylglutathione lyase family enzyme